MKPSVFSKLSAMMLLEYFVWGSWYVTMSTYMSTFLQSDGDQIGTTYQALAIATMISPFFIGMVADRFFSAQRIMGVLHLLGAAVLYVTSYIEDNTTFYWAILIYSLLYTPTIALSNSIAFQQMTDPGKQFPWIRVFGTLGWIFAGILIDVFGIGKTELVFYMASIASVALGLFSFALPNTPPKGAVEKTSLASAVGLEALVLLKKRSYLIFFLSAILVCVPLSFYYGFANLFLTKTGLANVTSKMTLGQISEAVFILAIPFLFYRIGVKKMLLISIVAWIARYMFFAFGNSTENLWMLYAGIILHGVCYDFFFVTGYMYTERKAGEKIKNAAQGLFTFATYGVGMFFGTKLSGYVAKYYTTGGIEDWDKIWMVPVYTALIVLLGFALLFNDKESSTSFKTKDHI
jgi:nucleoside transporter